MKKELLLALSLFVSAANAQAKQNAIGIQRDSVKLKRAATIHYYEQRLNELVQTYSIAPVTSDSLALPCPYYYKLFAPPVLYTEPIHNDMHAVWSPKSVSRIGSLTSLRTANGDNSLLLNDAINQALTKAYIQHPQYIDQTQADLMKETPLRDDVSAPITQDIKLTEKVAAPDDTPAVDAVEVTPQRPNFWTFKGNFSLQFSQSYYTDNWYKGGESFNSLLASTTMEYNYNNKQKVQWDNKLELRLGFQSAKSDTEHKYKTNSDLIRLTNKLGIQASTHWYYTFQSLAYTQFYPGYKSNDTKVYSDFMSPFNLVLSLGMDYKLNKKKFNCTVTLSPIAYNFRYVDRMALSTSYGLKELHRTYNHFGPSILANATWKITDYLSWTGRLYWFSDLSSNAIEFENTFNFKIGKYLSGKLFMYPRIDDSSENYKNEKGRYFMFQELFSLGFNYSI